MLAALECRPGDVLSVQLPPRGAGPAWQAVADRAAALGITVRTEAPRRSGGDEREGRAGGARAQVRPAPGVSTSELFADAGARAEGRGLWLALDGAQDPRNVGAVFRAAAFFGVQGVLVTKDRSAPLSAVAYDTASGGMEHMPFALVTNLVRELKAAQQAGLWILGAAEQATTDVSAIDRGRPWLLVLGGEQSGLRRLTRETCDETCRITPRGAVTSLNLSVAAAVLLASLTGPVRA